MVIHPDYRAAADEIMEVLWKIMPADECTLEEALVGLCQEVDKLRRDGDWDSANECCETGRRMVRQLCDSTSVVTSRFGEGFILMQLGTICLTCQKLEPTVECFRQAMIQFQSCNRRRSQSVAWMAIGQTHWLTEEWEKAMNAFQQSLNLLKSLRPTDHTTIEFKERVEKKLEQAQSAFFASIANKGRPPIGRQPSISHTPIPRPIPIVGTIAAGTGLDAQQDIEGYLQLSPEYAHDADFAVRVQGHSMIEDGVLERDLALIREQPIVENGTTAAVLILSEGQAEVEGTLKHYYKESDHHRLEPRNASEPTIVVIPVQADVDRITAHYRQQGKQILVRVGEARVLGKLVGIFREVD